MLTAVHKVFCGLSPKCDKSTPGQPDPNIPKKHTHDIMLVLHILFVLQTTHNRVMARRQK